MAQKYQVLCASVTIETGVNDTIVFYEPNGATSTRQTATIDPGTYYVYQDYNDGGTTDNLLYAVVDALDTASPNTYAYIITYGLRYGVDHTGVMVTIYNNTDDFRLDGSDSGCTFDLAWIGLTSGADTGQVGGIFSTISPSLTFISSQPRVLIDPGHWEAEVHQHIAADGTRHTFRAADVREHRRVRFENIERGRVFIEANSADPYRPFESWWKVARDGRPVRLYETEASSSTTLPDLTSSELVGTYLLTEESCARLDPDRPSNAVDLYAWDLMFAEYIA